MKTLQVLTILFLMTVLAAGVAMAGLEYGTTYKWIDPDGPDVEWHTFTTSLDGNSITITGSGGWWSPVYDNVVFTGTGTPGADYKYEGNTGWGPTYLYDNMLYEKFDALNGLWQSYDEAPDYYDITFVSDWGPEHTGWIYGPVGGGGPGGVPEPATVVGLVSAIFMLASRRVIKRIRS